MQVWVAKEVCVWVPICRCDDRFGPVIDLYEKSSKGFALSGGMEEFLLDSRYNNSDEGKIVPNDL